MSLIVLLLAAGRSARMRGRDKLREPVNGHPCLSEMAMRVLDAKLRLIVTVPDLLHPRNAALDGLNLVRVPVPDADQGMAPMARVRNSLPSDSFISIDWKFSRSRCT